MTQDNTTFGEFGGEMSEAAREQMLVEAVSDPGSALFKGVSAALFEADTAARAAARRRERVVLPFLLGPEMKKKIEAIFGWKVEASEQGVRTRLSASVGPLVHCMSLRALLTCGADGEEVVEIDGDVAVVAAKNFTYAHVCRTYATPRATAAYGHEELQLRRLAAAGRAATAFSAQEVLDQLRMGEGDRVCQSAGKCRRRADVILVNHARVSVSVPQLAAVADAHGASSVRGEVFFQPEMLTEVSGRLEAFPGDFLVDRDQDIISFIPDDEPSMGFSHCYSYLVEIFTHHGYVGPSGRWVVEKSVARSGIYQYVMRRADGGFTAPEVVGANYYFSHAERVVTLTYPWHDVRRVAEGLDPWVRRSVRVFEDVYERVVAKLLAMDAKDVGFAEACSAFRDRNNLYVVGGDTVRAPVRMSTETITGAAMAVTAEVRVRRLRASGELNAMLRKVEDLYGIAEASALELIRRNIELVWEQFVAGAGFSPEKWCTREERFEVSRGVAESAVVVVREIGGTEDLRPSSEHMQPFLPGYVRPARTSRLLARAMAFVKGRRGAGVHSSGSSRAGAAQGGGDVSSDVESSSVGSADVRPVVVVEVEREQKRDALASSAAQRELTQALKRKQDALSLPYVSMPEIAIEREATRVPVAPAEVASDPVSAAQTDYDRIFPGVSAVDADVLPYMAAECDFSRSTDANMRINASKREVPAPRKGRRCRIRTAGAGVRPRDQVGLLAALLKRNGSVPANRGFVDMDTQPTRVFDRMARVCFVDGWEKILSQELDDGLWLPSEGDLREYVAKLEPQKARRLLDSWFGHADVDMRSWLLMTKGKAKPPVDAAAASKVSLPQTILYNESIDMNAMYSSMLGRFVRVFKRLLRPNISFNCRDNREEHEKWFNSLEPLRKAARGCVYMYEADMWSYDRSQELSALLFENYFYRRMGLDEKTVRRWGETIGEKKAFCLMLGLIMFILGQGLSGIFKTLFRNGIINLAALVTACELRREDILSLEVVGDDSLMELYRHLVSATVVGRLSLEFNLASKFYSSDVGYICSKYWLRVGDVWVLVADPVKKLESLSGTVFVKDDESLVEKWRSLCDDLRHYDNGVVMENLAAAVQQRMGLDFRPYGLLAALSGVAGSREKFFSLWDPPTLVG